MGKIIKNVSIDQMINKIFKSVENINDKELRFTSLENNEIYYFYYPTFRGDRNSIYIGDICGDLKDLENSPLLIAEEVNSKYIDEWISWTFYKFVTIKGNVTVRWINENDDLYYSCKIELYLETNEE